MSDHTVETWHRRLQENTQAFAYPPTPDIAVAVTQRLAHAGPRRIATTLRLAGAVALVLMLLFAVLISVPSVRAAVLEFLQIGAIRIFLEAPTPTSSPLPGSILMPSADDRTPKPSTPTPLVPVDIASLLDLVGETTLEEAMKHAGFELLLPGYPEGLGLPQKVFLQDMAGAVVVFVWMEPELSNQVRLSLFQIGPGSWAGEKGIPTQVEHTRVNGEPALWTRGPYPLVLKTKGLEFRRLVDGNVLIWSAGNITYRLEGQLSLDEAVKIAESLTQIP